MEVSLNRLGAVFSSRNKAHEMFDQLPEKEDLILDFNNVEQVTPSFLHETLNILKQKSSKLQVKNVNESINFQLEKARAALNL